MPANAVCVLRASAGNFTAFPGISAAISATTRSTPQCGPQQRRTLFPSLSGPIFVDNMLIVSNAPWKAQLNADTDLDIDLHPGDVGNSDTDPKPDD